MSPSTPATPSQGILLCGPAATVHVVCLPNPSPSCPFVPSSFSPPPPLACFLSPSFSPSTHPDPDPIPFSWPCNSWAACPSFPSSRLFSDPLRSFLYVVAPRGAVSSPPSSRPFLIAQSCAIPRLPALPSLFVPPPALSPPSPFPPGCAEVAVRCAPCGVGDRRARRRMPMAHRSPASSANARSACAERGRGAGDTLTPPECSAHAGRCLVQDVRRAASLWHGGVFDHRAQRRMFVGAGGGGAVAPGGRDGCDQPRLPRSRASSLADMALMVASPRARCRPAS
ncbi:hypothetical protein C8J57DRAFT_1642895 [Mycena rebaudengoi]|nr:hypothetical protein C8J57DRAFT_1642895 [Mycena rebaudengoi]